MHIAELETPSLVVDLDVVERNVRGMAAHARRHGVALRPHAKTHKMAALAELQLAEGAIGLTLAKLGEVEALSPAGVDDVLVAFPIVGTAKIDRLIALARKIQITVAVDSSEAATAIGAAAVEAGLRIRLLVEVDSGGRRCGVLPGQPAVSLARTVAALPGVELQGIMTHEGQVYGAANGDDLRALSLEAGRVMVETAELIRKEGIELPVVSVGSTPSARHIAEVAGVTEIRPGTYVFYDYNHIRLGVASVEDCAAAVLATVIARPAPDRAVVDAGTKAVGADRFMIRAEPEGFGLVKGRPGWFFARASEEHGVLIRNVDAPADDLRIGDRVALVPNHICPTVNLHDEAVAHRHGEVVAKLPIVARGRSR